MFCAKSHRGHILEALGINYGIRHLPLLSWCQVGPVKHSKNPEYEPAHGSLPALWMFDCQSNWVLCGREQLSGAADLCVYMSAQSSIQINITYFFKAWKPDIPIINWIVGESGVLLNHCCDLLCKRICCWSNSVNLMSPCWQVPGVDLIWVLCVGSLDQDVDGMSFTQTGWCSCPLDHWSEIIMDDGQWWGESVCTLNLLAWCSLDFCDWC